MSGVRGIRDEGVKSSPKPESVCLRDALRRVETNRAGWMWCIPSPAGATPAWNPPRLMAA